MPFARIDDPKHWHIRAEEARAVAADMADPVARQMMLQVAGDYDRLAARAQDRLTRVDR